MTKVISLAPRGEGLRERGLSAHDEIPKQVRNDKYLSEAHGKELNVLTSYRLNDFKKKAGATHVDMSANIRRAAFTLAEVLITLGIIGVVAAMTIPTLIADYQERQTVSHLTKVYATLSNAYQMMQIEYGPVNTWGLNRTYTGQVDENGNPIYDKSGNDLLARRLREYLKVSKICEDGKVCYPGATYTLSGIKVGDANSIFDEESADTTAATNFYLQDGTFISCGYYIGGTANSSVLGAIYVVLPDKKGRVVGKSWFYFTYNSKGLFPAGRVDDTIYPFSTCCDRSSSSLNGGYGCAAWVIYNKNMDYLHCDDLSWDGKHKCD